MRAYLAARAGDVKQALICQRQMDAIRVELAVFQRHFSENTLAELAMGKLLEYIRRNQASLKTQNNRRALLFTFFKYSCARGWFGNNPLEGTTRHRVDHNSDTA